MICRGSVPDAEPVDHIRGHIEESYYVPSLLANAVEMFQTSQATEAALAYFWSDGPAHNFWLSFAKKQLEKVLRRYLYRQVGTTG